MVLRNWRHPCLCVALPLPADAIPEVEGRWRRAGGGEFDEPSGRGTTGGRRTSCSIVRSRCFDNKMPRHPNYHQNGKGKEERKRFREVTSYVSYTPEQGEASSFRRTNADPPVLSEQVEALCGQQNKSNTNHTSEKRNARRDRDRARRQSLTSEQREEINARRRARYQHLTPEEREQINARRRARIQNLTPEEREELNARRRARTQNLRPEERDEINARRRSRSQNLTPEEREAINARRRARRHNLTLESRQNLTEEARQERNARQRARRKSLPPEEQRALLDQRNARYAARRDTPCKDSIALQCLTGSSAGHPFSCSYPFSYPSNLESIREEEEDLILFAGTGVGDTFGHKELTSMQCHTPAFVDNPSSAPPASIDNPSSDPEDHCICSDSSTENFASDDDNSNISEEQDDEYFIFASRGDDEDLDGQVDSSASEPTPLTLTIVSTKTYQILEPMPDCKHCGAKRFQYEPNGFCCRSGKIKLAHTEPPMELHRLYTSSDPDAVHFRDNIRYFNGHFSFTTLGVSLDNRYTNMRSGVYTFRAQGQIYHNVFSFGQTEDGPKHLELYFYDDDPTLQHRFRRSPNLDRDVIRRLVEILKDNPYSQTFRNIGGADDLEEIVLN
ncbi:hypothetical protein EJB05_37035 [Eragrostis curvula]|uniref:Helitron helicase-like domain-containing protein n=1 Tax=Eragrostis curvula TaxID=38414 RepID=A0A5J9TQS6_9POAL|nr:hypothetical protein EJB05_37035 [Eragrostis curvula]